MKKREISYTVGETLVVSCPGKDVRDKSPRLVKKIPETEESGRVQSMESQKVRHKLATKTLKTLKKEGAWLNSKSEGKKHMSWG